MNRRGVNRRGGQLGMGGAVEERGSNETIKCSEVVDETAGRGGEARIIYIQRDGVSVYSTPELRGGALMPRAISPASL